MNQTYVFSIKKACVNFDNGASTKYATLVNLKSTSANIFHTEVLVFKPKSMKHLGLLFLLVIGCSAQGAEWTDEETEIIAEKLWDIIVRPGRAIKQYLKAHSGYTAIPQGRPTPQKVHYIFFKRQLMGFELRP